MRKISYIKCFSLEYTSATMYVFKDGSVYEPIPMPISIPNTKYRMNEGLSSSFSPPYPSLLLTRSAIQIRVYVCRSVDTPVSMRTEKKTLHAHKSISTYTLLTCLHEGLNPVLSPTIHTLSSFLSTDNYAKETHSDFGKEVCQRYVYPHASLHLCPTYLISSSILFCFIFLFFYFFISLDFGF